MLWRYARFTALLLASIGIPSKFAASRWFRHIIIPYCPSPSLLPGYRIFHCHRSLVRLQCQKTFRNPHSIKFFKQLSSIPYLVRVLKPGHLSSMRNRDQP